MRIRKEFLAVLWLLLGPSAMAASVAGFTGTYLGANEGLVLGGETVIGITPEAEAGIYYEHASRQGATQEFYAALGRLHFFSQNIFIDATLGYRRDADARGQTSSGLKLAGGAGYSIALYSSLELRPRLALELASTNTPPPYHPIELSIALAFTF
jgi:hypothetical protein